MTLSWLSVNANDGSIITDLPGLKPDGTLKATIGRHETQSATLPLDGAPPNWRQATRKKAVFLVALQDEAPIWGGMVTERTTSHMEGVTVSMATAEDYFNDRYVGDETFFTMPQNSIVTYLVEKYAATDGIPIRVVELPGPNPVRGRTYADADDKTLFSVLDELSGVIDGPEWTVAWEWVGNKLGLVCYVGARLGASPPAGLGPAAQFVLPGNTSDATLVEGFRRGEGANDVMANSSGAGDARPQSPRQTNPGDLRPKVEFRWSPSTSITEASTLVSHAQRALAAMKDGTVALAIKSAHEDAPKLGAVWTLGDDIGFKLVGPAWPDGISGTARAIGWEIDDKNVIPVLDVTGIEGIE